MHEQNTKHSIFSKYVGEVSTISGQQNGNHIYYNLVETTTDICSILEITLQKYNKIPNSIKKGLSRAFNKFDDDDILNHVDTKKIKLVDAIKLLHPKPTNDNKESINKLIMGVKYVKTC